jgi:NACHT domain/TIR domain
VSTVPERTKVFISYSHNDARHLDRLHVHLAHYERLGLIESWDDTKIVPGTIWREEIKRAIASAKVAILLVSADFLASQFIVEDELPPLLTAAQAGGAVILSIILSPCGFEASSLSQFQALNSPSNPLSRKNRHEKEEIWLKAAQVISNTVVSLKPLVIRDENIPQAAKDEQEHLKIDVASIKPSKKYFTPEAYRNALYADPHIALLQILNMSRPLDVTDIYIRMRLYRETRSKYELDPALLNAATRHDPNELLKESRLWIKSRTTTPITPEKAIYDHKRIVILGDPGTGKTTLLKYLALKSVDHQLTPDLPDLPIHIELNAFGSSGHSDLLEFAASVWERRYGFPQAKALTYMQTQLEEGRALLLLDALDETVTGKTREESEESYRRVVQAIMSLASYTPYYESPMIVTVRKAGYQQHAIRLTGFTELEVLDFRLEEIKQFVNRWFASHPEPRKQANAADLNARLGRNLRVQTLATNPLLLSLMVLIYEDQLDLPDRRAELYKQCVDTLLNKWDASRIIRRHYELKPEQKYQLLGEVAWHFHLEGQRYFPENELLTIIANFSTSTGLPSEQKKQMLDEIAVSNSLLKEQANGWYGFLHLTLQEYFAARYAVDHNELSTILEHCFDPWWEEVILLYASYTPDASLLLQKLLGQRDDIFCTNSILAGRCLATGSTVKQIYLRAEIISRLFGILKQTPYLLTQKQIANVLAEIGGTEVNKRLLDAIRDSQLNTLWRETIAHALGNSGDRSIVPNLLGLLHDCKF